MARIQLQYPDALFTFSIVLPVRQSDVNAANHLGNDKMATMISEARDAFFIRHGLREAADNTLNTVLTDQVIVYRAESRARDPLRFDIGITDLNKYGGDVIYRVTRETDGRRIADAKTGFVFFLQQQGRIAAMPDWFSAQFRDAARV